MHSALRIRFVGSLASLAFFACHPASKGSFQVAGHQFSERDVGARVEEQTAENPGTEITPVVATYQLMRAYLGAEILAKYDRPVTASVLEAEAQRIEKTTLMPEKLKELRGLFGSREDWLRLYVLPVYVNRVIYFDFFMHHPDFHFEPRNKLEDFKRELEKSHAKMEVLAKQRQLSYSEIRISKNGVQTLRLPERKWTEPSGDSAEMERLIDQVLSKMKAGGLSSVVEWGPGYSLLRLRSVRNGVYEAESVVAPKAGFEPWFKSEARLIPVACIEKEHCPQAMELLFK